MGLPWIIFFSVLGGFVLLLIITYYLLKWNAIRYLKQQKKLKAKDIKVEEDVKK